MPLSAKKKEKGFKLLYTAEPGSWVMFLAAFAAGAAKAASFGIESATVLLTLFLFLLAKSPALKLIKNREPQAVWSALVLGVPAISGLVFSAMRGPFLLPLYAAGGALLALNLLSARRGHLLRAEAFGMAVMGLAAVMAESAGDGRPAGLYLWPIFFAFFFSSSFRVRLAVKKYRIIGALYAGAILTASAALALMGHLLFIAFSPLLEDFYSALKGGREKFREIGLKEAAKTAIFAAIVIMLPL